MKTKDERRKTKVRGGKEYYLILDPGVSDGTSHFFVCDEQGEEVIAHIFEKGGKSIELVLAAVDEGLNEKKLSLHDVKGIMVLKGGESFSTVRGAHAIANALSWSLGIPAVKVVDAERRRGAQSALAQLKRRKKFRLLIPEYSREPNITVE